jgi:hypothetical protein
MRGRLTALGAAVAICSWIAACTGLRSPRTPELEPLPAVAQFERSESYDALGVLLEPEFSAPTHLRPCCAFGHDLELDLSSVPVPLVTLDNLVDPKDLGQHSYDGGYLSLEHGIEHGFVSKEKNGLVYTCRGGFIDLAHVRDYADWTVFLARRLSATLASGVALELPEEGGRRFVLATAIERDRIDRAGPGLPAQLAQWAAFQLSLWHEVITWYGWSAIELFPERASAFSPEDLYSNLLGTHIASYLYQAGLAEDEDGYAAAMDGALQQLLELLGALPPAGTARALDAVDGQWWNSRARLPDPGVVLRRNLTVGPELDPWLIPPRLVTPELARDLARHCGDRSDERAVLRLPESVEGVPFEGLLRVDFRLDAELAPRVPHRDDRSPWLSNADFGRIEKRMKREFPDEFGLPAVDRRARSRER